MSTDRRPDRRRVTAETPPTGRTAAVYAFIFGTMEREGRQPTLREVTRAMGMRSVNGAYCHYKALERRGYIRLGVTAGGTPRNHFDVLRCPDGRPFVGFVAK